MPLGTDVVDIAQQATTDRLDRVVVQDVVVPLMPDDQQLVGLLGNPRHLLALMDTVGHELLGQDMLALAHRLDRRLVMQMQRQRDDDPFDIGVVEQLVVLVRVDLDVLAGFVLGLPAVLGHQPRSRGERVSL